MSDAKSILKEVGDKLMEQLQKPEVQEAIDKVFDATPEELGKAALEGAKRMAKAAEEIVKETESKCEEGYPRVLWAGEVDGIHSRVVLVHGDGPEYILSKEQKRIVCEERRGQDSMGVPVWSTARCYVDGNGVPRREAILIAAIEDLSK